MNGGEVPSHLVRLVYMIIIDQSIDRNYISLRFVMMMMMILLLLLLLLFPFYYLFVSLTVVPTYLSRYYIIIILFLRLDRGAEMKVANAGMVYYLNIVPMCKV